jgi:hypothetical protein
LTPIDSEDVRKYESLRESKKRDEKRGKGRKREDEKERER